MRSYNLVSKSELKIARESIYNRDNNTCQICKLNFKEKLKVKKNIDHIIPRSTVAWSHPFNLQLLCEICNEEKGSDVPDEFQKILENNVKKTTEWFINQPPKDNSKEEMMKYDVREALEMTLFNFEKHFDTFALYYDDQYINDMIGMDFYDTDSGGIFLEAICTLTFNNELKSYVDGISEDIKESGHSLSSLKRKSKVIASKLEGLSFKLRRTNNIHLSKKYSRMAYNLLDVLKGGFSFD